MSDLFKVYDVDDQLPESNTSVLAYVEDDSTATSPYWTIAHFNGNHWIFDVTEDVLEYASKVTSWNLAWIKFPETATVTHWVVLPPKPVERGYRSIAEITVAPVPTVEYNHNRKTIEIFGKPSPYTKRNPYILDAGHYKDTAEALDTLAHLGGKKWGVGSTFLRRVAKAMCQAMEDLPSQVA